MYQMNWMIWLRFPGRVLKVPPDFLLLILKFEGRETNQKKFCYIKKNQNLIVLKILSSSRYQMMLKLTKGFQAKIKFGLIPGKEDLIMNLGVDI